MATRITTEQVDVLGEQARKVRLLYPELFDALTARDRQLYSALCRIPHPDDPESFVPSHVWQQSIRELFRLDRGIAALAHGQR